MVVKKKPYHKLAVQIYGNLTQMTAASTNNTASRDANANPPATPNTRRT